MSRHRKTLNYCPRTHNFDVYYVLYGYEYCLLFLRLSEKIYITESIKLLTPTYIIMQVDITDRNIHDHRYSMWWMLITDSALHQSGENVELRCITFRGKTQWYVLMWHMHDICTRHKRMTYGWKTTDVFYQECCYNVTCHVLRLCLQ